MYDIQSISWKNMWDFVKDCDLGDWAGIDITNGVIYPCWLWLSSTGTIAQVAKHAVSQVLVAMRDGERCIIVLTTGGAFRVFQPARTNRTVIELDHGRPP